MNLPEVSHDNPIRGFTLIEMLLVTSLLLILGVFSFPLGLSFYTAQQLNEATEGVHDALKKAQIYAQSGKNDSSFGVFIGEGQYVLFEGESYQTRNQSEDLAFGYSGRLSFDGIHEVVFRAHSIEPTQAGDIHIYSADRSETITVTSAGRIDH